MKSTGLLLCWFLLIPAVACAQSSFGLIWEDTKSEQDSLPPLLVKATPPIRLSYKAYCPSVIDQQDSWACVGYACGYYLMTMIDAINQRITDRSRINELAYSAGYLYDAIKPSTDIRCQAGTKLSTALSFLKTNGIIRQQQHPYAPCRGQLRLQGSKNGFHLGDFSALFSLQHQDSTQKIQRLKMALWAGYPVVVGLAASNSFREGMMGKAMWEPTARELALLQNLGGHALCVIGYDDTRYGGAFEVVNSFGTHWGQGGFGWIPYRVMARFARLGYQAYGNPIRKGDGMPDDPTAEIAFQLTGGEAIPIHQTDSTGNGLWTGSLELAAGKSYTILLKNKQPTYVYLFEISFRGLLNRIIPQANLPDYQPAAFEWHDLLGAYTWTVDDSSKQDQFLIILAQQPLTIETIERQLREQTFEATPEGLKSLSYRLGLMVSTPEGLSSTTQGTARIRWFPGLIAVPLLISVHYL